MRKSVLISNVLPSEARALIPADYGVDYNDTDIPLPKSELIRRLRDKDALICHIISTVDEEVVAGAPGLKAVCNVAVGFNNVDVAACKKRGIIVTNRVLYHDTVRAEADAERELRAIYVDRDALLREADFVSLHTLFIPETKHLLNEGTFRLMKKTAILVNAARGPIIDEAALVRALKEGWIAGAGLDVFEEEPKIHPGLLSLPNVTLAPHIASASLDTRLAMANLAVRNCLAVLEGKPAITPVA